MLITYDPQHPLRGVNQSISLEFLLHGYKECQQLFFLQITTLQENLTFVCWSHFECAHYCAYFI